MEIATFYKAHTSSC